MTARCALNNLLWPQPSSSIDISAPPFDLVVAEDVEMVAPPNNTCCHLDVDAAIIRFKRRSFTQAFYSTFNVKSSSPSPSSPPTTISLKRIILRIISDSPTTTGSSCLNGHIDPVALSNLSIKDEKYTIDIDISMSEVRLSATHSVGILRSLVTLSQLVRWNPQTQQHTLSTCGELLKLSDQPRFAWRGLMLDTARHYFNSKTILRILNGMEMLKLNVFHWHIVDAQSFPYQSKRRPQLAQAGSYHYPDATYDDDDIQRIVNHAGSLGIRVVPEFDMPSHAGSWGKGYADVVVTCPELVEQDAGAGIPMREHGIDRVSLNPLKNVTYELIDDLLADIADSFSDQHVHVGGDEANKECWEKNEAIQQWINDEHGGQGHASNLLALFERHLLKLLAKHQKIPIVWDEVLDVGDPTVSGHADGDVASNFPKGTIVQWWRGWSPNVLERAVERGFQVVQSHPYYLDHLDESWSKMYSADLDDALYGGEACSWSEHVNEDNVDHRIFEKLPAIAERLWSTKEATGSSAAAAAGERDVMGSIARRMGRVLCMLKQREGILVGPIYPDFCSQISVAVRAEPEEQKEGKMLLRSQHQHQHQHQTQRRHLLSDDASSWRSLPSTSTFTDARVSFIAPQVSVITRTTMLATTIIFFVAALLAMIVVPHVVRKEHKKK